jgi:hypothetical protein
MEADGIYTKFKMGYFMFFFKVWNHGIKRRKTAINIIFWDFVF